MAATVQVPAGLSPRHFCRWFDSQSVSAPKHRSILAAAVVLAGLLLLVAWASKRELLAYEFRGYEYTVTTRLGVFSITNLGSFSVEFAGPVEVHFADGWRPAWGEFVVVHNSPTIAGRSSAIWRFEVPPHPARWKVRCVVRRHALLERVVSALSNIRMLAWTERFGRVPTNTFSSDWIRECRRAQRVPEAGNANPRSFSLMERRPKERRDLRTRIVDPRLRKVCRNSTMDNWDAC